MILAGRVDSAALLIAAVPDVVFAAFRTAEAYARWLPPPGMRARVAAYELRPGGVFDITLRYTGTDHPAGKSSAGSDRARGRFVAVDPPHRIVQTAVFVGDNPAFAGEMWLTWTFAAT